MADYIIQAADQMMVVMLILGLTFAYSSTRFQQIGVKIFRIGVIAGFVGGAVMSILKNTTGLINTETWNFNTKLILTIAFVAFIVLSQFEKKLGSIPSSICLTAVVFLYLFFTLPDFYATPYQIYTAETTFFSSSYIIKLGGFLIGFALTLIACFAANRLSHRFTANQLFWITVIVLGINEVQQLSKLVSFLIVRAIIPSSTGLFQFALLGNNHDNVFIFSTLGVFVVMGIVLVFRSYHVHEPYSNPAQHRKIRAKWRNVRRWCTTTFVCTACTILLLTVVNTVVNAETELSPTEDSTVVGDNIVVSFDQVNDGHLHRFGYTTDNGVQVRFIVIQKPNSTTYGVGMDACDICGQTGYYENGQGEVVCNRCNVVMNINTIGFEGGCNPKVFDYTVQDNKIIIPIESVTQYEADFK